MNIENGKIILIDLEDIREILKDIIAKEMNNLTNKLVKESKILTREEAAIKLNVCNNTISDYVKRGQLKNRGLGRKILILESDLEGIKPNRYTIYKRAS
jgi:hypothetical protein